MPGDEPRYAAVERLGLPALRDRILALAQTCRADAPDRGGEPVIVAVDGRSAAGKSTLAARLAQTPGWYVVATDDVAWWHDFFDWTELLRDGVLLPARRGEDVAYVPPAWAERGREGAIGVPAGTRVLLVEGVGASRRALADLVDVAVWVRTPFERVVDRERARLSAGESDADLQRAWMAAELDFLAADRPWDRADLVVSGTDPDADSVVVMRPEEVPA